MIAPATDTRVGGFHELIMNLTARRDNWILPRCLVSTLRGHPALGGELLVLSQHTSVSRTGLAQYYCGFLRATPRKTSARLRLSVTCAHLISSLEQAYNEECSQARHCTALVRTTANRT